MESLRGQLLISSGGLFDPNFRHTVVLIGEHNDEGALGVVLNRALEQTVADVVPSLGSLVPDAEPIYLGGPVQPNSVVLLAELARPGLADVPVMGSLGFLVGEIKEEVRSAILRARVYVGYSGWGPGQLEAEMEQDSWILDPAQDADVFTSEPEQLWGQVLSRKGPRYELMSRVPFDPTMN